MWGAHASPPGPPPGGGHGQSDPGELPRPALITEQLQAGTPSPGQAARCLPSPSPTSDVGSEETKRHPLGMRWCHGAGCHLAHKAGG